MIYNRASDDDLEFLIKNIRKGVDFCAKELGVTKLSIKIIAGKHKIRRNLNKIDKDNSVDISNFENIDKPEVAYLLGLLWADGYITESKKGYGKVGIEASLEDISEVKSLFSGIINFREYVRSRRERSRKSILSLSTSNRPIYYFLFKHDYKSKSISSPCKIISKIPDDLKKYFWRGYFDGDGNIHVDTAGRYSFSFAGSFNQDWTAMENLLNSLGIKYSINRHDVKASSSKASKINCQNRYGFLKFFSYIYADYDNIGFSRKYNTFLQGLDLIKELQERLLKRSCPLLCYDKNWNFIRKFDSIQQASRELKIKDKLIREYFRFQRSRCYQYQFKKDRIESGS
jgi:DNA-binding transcriptional regulator WhiA